MTTKDGTLGRYLAWFLAALSLGAGAIHLGVTGEHFGYDWTHGWFFAVVAWFQLIWAAAIIVRPDQRLLGLGAVVSAGVIAVWFVSRVWGVPVGPEEWEPEPVALADGLATGFEAGILVIGVAVLAAPGLPRRAVRPALGLGGVGITTLAIAVVSTVALSPSFASDHHHGADDAEHAAGHDHGSEGHEHDAEEADPVSVSEEEIEGLIPEGDWTDEQLVYMLDRIEATKRVLPERFPATATKPELEETLGDMGFYNVGVTAPGGYDHYIQPGWMLDEHFIEPEYAESLVYQDQGDGQWELVSAMYMTEPDDTVEDVPEDIAWLPGWHTHPELCVSQAGRVVGVTDPANPDCPEGSGQADTGPMMHIWIGESECDHVFGGIGVGGVHCDHGEHDHGGTANDADGEGHDDHESHEGHDHGES